MRQFEHPFWPTAAVSGGVVLLAAAGLLGLYLQTARWQPLALSGLAAGLLAVHGPASWLAHARGRPDQGIWLIAGARIASALLAPLILADFWLIGLVLLLIVPLEVGVADRLHRIPLFAILALLGAAGMLAIDLLGSPGRLVLLAGRPGAAGLAAGLLGLHLATLSLLMWRRRLRGRLELATKQTLVFTLIAIGSIVLVTSVLIAQIRSAQITQVGRNFQTLASFNAERVGSQLEQQIDSLLGFGQRSMVLLDGLAAANAAYPASSADALQLLREREQAWQAAPDSSDLVRQTLSNPQSLELSRFRGTEPRYTSLLLIDQRGGLAAADGRRPPRFYYAGEAWWQGAWAGGQGGVHLGQLEFDPQTQSGSVFIAVGIPDPRTGQAAGVLAATYELSAIQESIAAASRQAAADVQLLTSDGLVLAAPNSTAAGQPAPLRSLAAGAGALSAPGWLMGTDSLGQAVVLGQSPLQTSLGGHLDALRSLGWRVIVSDTQAQALAEVTRSTKVASLVGLLAIAVGVIATTATARVITRPINALTATAAAISAGSLEERAEPVGPVELVTLAEALNTLTDRHRALINSLQDQVKQRTTELARQNEYLAALYDTTLGMVSRLDLNDLLHAIVARAGQLLGTRHGFIYLAQPGEAELERQVGVGIFSENRAPRLKRGEGLSGKVWESGQPLVVDDYDAWPGRSPVGVNLVEAMAGVPLFSGTKVVGVIALASERGSGRTFGEEEVQLLTRFAQLASVALDNARLFAETQQRVRELEAINNISQAIASQLELSAIIDLVGEKLREAFDAGYIFIALYDQQTRLIYYPYFWEVDRRVIAEQPQHFGPGLTSAIIETRQPQLINSDWESQARALGVTDLSGPLPKASLGVPILIGEDVIGAIMLQSTEHEHVFGEGDVRLLTTIAATVGVALENARLFEEIQKAKEAAEAANAAKSMFLANVSHELRTPLTSVLGFAKLIQRRLEERVLPLVPQEDAKVQRAIEQIRENIDIILREGGRLTALINEVLDLAKIEAGKADWHMKPVHIEDVIDHALAATGALFEPKGLSLIREVPAGLPAVFGDQDRLIQVVINLLSNAVKFTERGSVTCQARQADGHIIVSVIDTGIGLSPGDQQKVFDKFTQAGDTLTNKPQGTGLGLSICRQIVEKHGGRIWVDSRGQPGSGSTFAFVLPIWEGPAPPGELLPAALAGAAEG